MNVHQMRNNFQTFCRLKLAGAIARMVLVRSWGVVRLSTPLLELWLVDFFARLDFEWN